MSTKRPRVPDSLFWNLKKIGYERGVRVSDVIIEAYQDYIKKNEHLLNQKITLISSKNNEVLLAQHPSINVFTLFLDQETNRPSVIPKERNQQI